MKDATYIVHMKDAIKEEDIRDAIHVAGMIGVI